MAHVVVVDDDPSIVTLLSATLRNGLGLTVTSFASAEAAIDAWPSLAHVDLLLTDFSMPGRTGVELAQFVRDHAPATPIVLLSAVDVPLQAPGVVTRCLTKPCPPKQLLPIIRELLPTGQPQAGQPDARQPDARQSGTGPSGALPTPSPALREKVVARLVDVRARLPALVAAHEQHVDGATRALRDALHQLIGTAGSFGFHDVTTAARALHAAVVDGTATPDLTRSLDSALSAVATPAPGQQQQ